MIESIVFIWIIKNYIYNLEEIGYDFVVLNNGKRIPISEDRRKIISGQYCEMEDTFYVDV